MPILMNAPGHCYLYTFEAPTAGAYSVAYALLGGFDDQGLDDDGDLHLLVHFETGQLQLSGSDTEAELDGTTLDGRVFRGSDSVTIVPPG